MATTGITEPNPTINAIAVDQGLPRSIIEQAIRNRKVPVKDGRVPRGWLPDLILEATKLELH
jgi:hypothetical protein